jgi:superfamily II DNA or RNA helicase
MVGSPVEFQAKVLRSSSDSDEYKVYRAALEWGLADPIVIETREDFRSEPRWREHLEPYHHQVSNLITFCRRLPVTLLADDVGLGKTISAGLIASELIARARISKILIVCPKLLGPQWVEELQTKFGIEAKIATGRKLLKAEPDGVGATITTYQSARLYLDKIPEDRFQMLVLDEAHKLRNLYGVESPPQVAVRFREALEARRFQYVLMLTATPIHNRLWDLYSLVDLLTVARGHANPFGSEGTFARKFIADDRQKARQLKVEAREEFRSIVYGYMSRVRRGDAKLYFPDRVVQLHRVQPTDPELELIEVLAKPIQSLNRLAQISILQALTSSPQALMAQLNTMARNGTVPPTLAAAVRRVVEPMRTSAKLRGLATLVEKLRKENPDDWRMVIFTGRLETQTTIQSFLEDAGIKVGIINGSSGQRNQHTIARFRKSPPDCRVIVSTEAGSEGVNLQVANVLVNYDLPWNPMIVEQRIGRIQRLASKHASVSILNVILRGTFEEYIVGRLMEKLQLAAHAIGDVESLLEASGLDGDDDSEDTGFENKILQLILAALAGKDVEAATRKEEESIAEAKATLEREEASINSMLGGMDGKEYVGPRAPKLPSVVRSMAAPDFTLAALRLLGAKVAPQSETVFLVEQNGGRELLCFDESHRGSDKRIALYAPGTAVFSRLVDKVLATGIHQVRDMDVNPSKQAEEILRRWTGEFGASYSSLQIDDVRSCFEGTALIQVRATVAHDNYERLVEISCDPNEHSLSTARRGLSPLSTVIEEPRTIGIDTDRLSEIARIDPSISEFCRFYFERRAQEVSAAGGDARKRQKLEDEFTPRIEMTLVALEGRMRRQLKAQVGYRFGDEPEFRSEVTVIPSTGDLEELPEFERCGCSGRVVPKDCLGRCELSGAKVLGQFLAQSELTARRALPEYVVVCSISRKKVLSDEVEVCAVSGQPVARTLLKTSPVSGRRAASSHFKRCEFSQIELLADELAKSDVSGRSYRIDQQARSVVSGKVGHQSEFILCHETRQPLLTEEAEQCELTTRLVRPGVLERCAVSQKLVLPSELGRCGATGKRVIGRLLVTSSVSGAKIMERFAVRSASGRCCAPLEARRCAWSGRNYHPDDLRECNLTGVSIYFQFSNGAKDTQLQSLWELLQGVRRTADESERWNEIETEAARALNGGRCRVQAAHLSPDRRSLAVFAEMRTILGFKKHDAGLVYSIDDKAIVGRIVVGKRTNNGWVHKVAGN